MARPPHDRVAAMTTEQDRAESPAASAPASGRKIVNLALQGGGSHGAITWGVLDRLIEESGLEFERVTGTSAGAVNAVVLADGSAAGGREGAREALRVYWKKCRCCRPVAHSQHR